MVIGLVLGAIVAAALFVVRLLLPAAIAARYDCGVLTLFRLIGLAGVVTVASIGAYAILIAR